MQLGTVIIIVVIFANFPTFGESANETEDSTSAEVQKILVECNHSDYRTYLACLKRQKRHHVHAEPESVGENKNCMRKCDVDKCTTSSCMKNCYQRCFEKTKETHHVITEYSTNCSPGENCHEERQGIINITANIDIKNIMENPTATIPSQPLPREYVPSTPRESFTSTEKTRNATCVSFGCYIMGILMVPQVQYAPPVNNYPGNTGCNQWSCPNTYQLPPDCSACGNPFMRYRCDFRCYPYS
ncbi:uncharacterized protein LOC107274548 [Cephus cinctus]|uniref:Uncharacterized protein LOC107274548 n=1 Tax=Cephus cinctus TaxID=211228 RepID=A0AAJ7FUQ0_CEPCN|nr:uncharacterized protein LOC107274548 [Cephus cinctus]